MRGVGEALLLFRMLSPCNRQRIWHLGVFLRGAEGLPAFQPAWLRNMLHT